MEGLTPDSGLRILSPCEFTRFGAAVVVLPRRTGNWKFWGPLGAMRVGLVSRFRAKPSQNCSRVGPI